MEQMWIATMGLIQRLDDLQTKVDEMEEQDNSDKTQLACLRVLNKQLQLRVEDIRHDRSNAQALQKEAEKKLAAQIAISEELRKRIAQLEAKCDQKDSLLMEKDRELNTLKRDRASLESSREQERQQNYQKTLKVRKAHGALTRSLGSTNELDKEVAEALGILQEVGIHNGAIH